MSGRSTGVSRMTNSLKGRLALAGLVVLIAFLGLTGLALDKAFRTSALEGVRATLQAQVYGLLGAVELDARGRVQMPAVYPDQRLQQPGSGSYAQIIVAGEGAVWTSRSLLGRSFPYQDILLASGESRFERVKLAGESLFELRFGVVWEYAPNQSKQLILRVLESDSAYLAQVWQFRRSLMLWLGVAGVILLIVQIAILQWGLRPLRRISADIGRIHAGEADMLDGQYPGELRPLTDNLNDFIHAERAQRRRYRDAMADLAHSLKTPLAVMRGAATQEPDSELAGAITEQTARMQEIVEYQLQRAAMAGQVGLREKAQLYPTAKRVTDSLAKVYADKAPVFDLRMDRGLQLAVEAGDLMELMGNLLDNACKWAGRHVRVSAGRRGDELWIAVEDDGPGISEADRARIFQRGVRADESTPGHGIGMAMVRDIVQAYGGRLDIDTSPDLGGARVTLVFARG